MSLTCLCFFLDLTLDEWSEAKVEVQPTSDLYIRERRKHIEKSGKLLIQNIVVSFQNLSIVFKPTYIFIYTFRNFNFKMVYIEEKKQTA